jgi:hypothetical protein
MWFLLQQECGGTAAGKNEEEKSHLFTSLEQPTFLRRRRGNRSSKKCSISC